MGDGTFDFQSLGLDRLSQNIKRAVTNPTGTLTTGDISKGEVVTVGPAFTNSNATATVSPRRTGAIMIARSGESDVHLRGWGINDVTLTVYQSDDTETTYTFWVF